MKIKKEKFKQNQKGITLIALIITIIVMLILVGVTITMASNGGVFDSAKKATKQYQEAEFEEKLNSIFTSYAMKDISGEDINYRQTVNEILDIFDYPKIDESTGELQNEEANKYTIKGTTDETSGKVIVADENENEVLKVKYNKSESNMQIFYNGEKWTYEKFSLKSKEEIQDINTEYEGEEIKVEGKEEYTCGVWKYTKNENGTLTIIGYLGTTEQELTNIVVPNKINGVTVESLTGCNSNAIGILTISPKITITGNYALKNLTKIEKIVFGDEDIISSGDMLYGCKSVKELVFGENVQVTQGIGNPYITNITLGEGTKFLGAGTIRGTSIIELNIPDNCNFYGIAGGERAFMSSTKLEKLTIGNNVNILGWGDFNGCPIKTITVGNNCNINTSSSFADLEELNLGDNNTIKYISSSKISKVTAGNGNSIELTNCTNISNEFAQELMGKANVLFYNGTLLTDINIPTNVTEISKYMFYKCTNLKTVVIPNTVTQVGQYAFNCCSSLQSIKVMKKSDGTSIIINSGLDRNPSTTTDCGDYVEYTF